MNSISWLTRTRLQFSDASRLLKFYQLWLDDMFPRAKFSDGLAIIEKLGHSKRLQVMRKQWIEDEKPRGYIPGFDDASQRDSAFPDADQAVRNNRTDDGAAINTMAFPSNQIDATTEGAELHATSEPPPRTDPPGSMERPSPSADRELDLGPDEEGDELDALLNDGTMGRGLDTAKQQEHDPANKEDDELDALLNEGGAIGRGLDAARQQDHDAVFEDELEAMEGFGILEETI